MDRRSVIKLGAVSLGLLASPLAAKDLACDCSICQEHPWPKPDRVSVYTEDFPVADFFSNRCLAKCLSRFEMFTFGKQSPAEVRWNKPWGIQSLRIQSGYGSDALMDFVTYYDQKEFLPALHKKVTKDQQVLLGIVERFNRSDYPKLPGRRVFSFLSSDISNFFAGQLTPGEYTRERLQALGVFS